MKPLFTAFILALAAAFSATTASAQGVDGTGLSPAAVGGVAATVLVLPIILDDDDDGDDTTTTTTASDG